MTESPRQTSALYPPCSHVPMTPAHRRALLLQGVDVVLDVGANEGQYGTWLRGLGFHGRIVSFEPQPKPFQVLSRVVERDGAWQCHDLALGATDSELDLHVSLGSVATSAFEPTAQHLRTSPDAAGSGSIERVPMRALDSLWPSLDCEGKSVYLKVDVEGFELAVLEGARRVLDSVTLLELEISIARMYHDAPLIRDVLDFLGDRFSIVALEQNYGDDPQTGQMLMIDGLFRRVTTDGRG